MNIHELSLVIFTVAAQMSVGAFLVLGVVNLFATRYASAEEADKLSDYALLAIGPVLVFGLIMSVFHLGNPLNAPRSIMHLSTSWLSREILFGILFAGFGFLFAIMQWRKIGGIVQRKMIGLLVAIFGILLVYSMAMVYYVLESVPVWSTLSTPISFFATTVLLGAMAVGVAFVTIYAFLRRRESPDTKSQANPQSDTTKKRKILETTLRWMSLLAVIVLGVQLVIQPLYMAYLATGSPTAQKSASILIDQFGMLFALRQVLLFLGAGVFSLFIYFAARSSQNLLTISALAYSAFIIVVAGELIGRFLFYASFARIGPL